MGTACCALGTGHEGDFVDGDAVEVLDVDGTVVAKGLVRLSADEWESGDDIAIHRDDLVLLRSVN